MWMNALRTMEDAVNMPPVPTYLTASIAPAILDTLVMVSTVQVRFSLTFKMIFSDRMNYDPDGDPVFYNALRKYIRAPVTRTRTKYISGR